MRVLVVTNMLPTPRSGSRGIFVANQLDAIRAMPGAPELHVCHVDTMGQKSRYLSGRRDVAAAVLTFVPDLIHIHYGLSQILMPTVRVPTVLTVHGSDLMVPWQRRITCALMPGRDMVICVAPHLREMVPASQLAEVVPCGVPGERVYREDRAAARRHLGLSDKAVIAVFGARPERPEKRYDLFIRTLAELRHRGLAVHGIHLGQYSVADAPCAIAAADVMLFTSSSEGSPVVTKEALCSGTRVVSTDVGDVAGQLAGFSGCRLVKTSEAAALASAFLDSLSEPPPDAGLAGERFHVGVEARAIVGLYGRLLASGSAVAPRLVPASPR